MTKGEFCEKWRRGWKEVYIDGTQAYFYTRDQMMNDLNRVIHDTVCEWKKFVDDEVCRTVDLDEWQRKEAEEIQKRRNNNGSKI